MAAPPPDLYNVRNTHKLFLASSLALTGALAWMAWADYDREWKHVQRDFNRIEHAKLRREIAAEAKRVEEGRARADVERQLAEAQAGLKRLRGERAGLEEAARAADGSFYNADRDYKDRKSDYDSIRYFFDEARHHREGLPEGDPHLPGAEREFQKQQDRLAKAENDLAYLKREQEKAEKAQADARAALEASRAGFDAAARRAEAIERDLRALERRAGAVDTASPLYQGRNAPLVDFINPSVRIQQILLPHLQDDINFIKIGKVDRCHSCHLTIDNPNYAAVYGPRKGPEGKGEVTDWHFADPELQAAAEDVFPDGASGAATRRRAMIRVLRTHPRLDLYLSSASPHPIERFGCTVCHEGDGRSLSFVTAAHTADDEAQAAEWKQAHDWHPMHHWDTPMPARRFQQSACYKCHASQAEIAGASRWQQGRDVFARVGCFGCHKTENFEARSPERPDGERKVGPALDHIADKVTPAWAYQWILAPKSFRPATRMPTIFGHANMAEFGTDEIEVGAVVAYLFHTSRPLEGGYEEPPRTPGSEPEIVERGKKTVEGRGCLACHRLGPDERPVDRFTSLEAFGPSLDGIGSKTTPRWLYNWLRDPKRYFPESKMPNLRLSKEEAADAAAFLMTLKNEAFAAKASAVPAPHDEKLAHLAREYLESKYPSYQVGDNQGTWRDLLAREVWDAAKRRDDVAGPLLDWIARLPKKADQEAARGILEGALDAIGAAEDAAARAARVDEIARALAPYAAGGPEADALRDASARLKDALARARSALDPLTPTQWAQLYVGERTINRQGCFGCHDRIRGFEKAVPIGVELSGKQAIGSKNILRFDFGFSGIPETREEWLRAKLLDPRRFDLHKRKTREEKLRMPDFGFTDEEAQALVVFLASLTNVEHPADVVKTLSPAERDIEKGKRLVLRNNCRGCHQFQMEQVTFLHETGGKAVPVTVHGWVSAEDAENQELFVQLWRDEIRIGKRAGENAAIPFGRIVRRTPPEGGGLLEQFARAHLAKATEQGEETDLPAARLARRPEAPPILYGQGGKTQSDWLVRFLQAPTTIRPWLEVRMPTFGLSADEAAAITRYFYALNAADRAVTRDGFVVSGRKTQHTEEHVRIQVDRGEDVDVRQVHLARLEAEDATTLRPFPELDPDYYGRLLAETPNPVSLAKVALEHPEKDTLRCANCHIRGSAVPQQPKEKLGPDLLRVRERLRPDWIRRWLADPQKVYSGTSMPTFPWGSPDLQKAFPDFHPLDGARQIEAVKDYLMNRLQDTAQPAGPAGH